MLWDWKTMAMGPLIATLMVLPPTITAFLPMELRSFLRRLLDRIIKSLRPTHTIVIEESNPSIGTNDIFIAAQSYLHNTLCTSNLPVIHLSKPRNSPAITASLPPSHAVTDSFNGIRLTWNFLSVTKPSSKGESQELRYYELSFHRRYRQAVHSEYIPHVIETANRIRLKSRKRYLYTNLPTGRSDLYPGSHHWTSVQFTHPSTFDTLAIDPVLRDDIRADLVRFRARGDYYARVGRAWKRGYLLHGPPGTGKTSLIAAIANFLEFDIYDIELTAVTSNSHLRNLLVSTTSKSVIVIEDIDCSLDLSNRNKEKVKPESDQAGRVNLNLSGVLNFADGLWSSCVGERLMVFTTNHPDRLDPALVRPGRMDKRIHLSYCGAAALRRLAKNYLEVGEGHVSMGEAESLVGEARMTPAEVAEVFMGCEEDGADVAMDKVLVELRRRLKMRSDCA